MVEIFRAGSMVSTLIGLAGLIGVIFFLIVKIVNKDAPNSIKIKTRTLNFAFVLSLLSFTYAFIYFIIKEMKHETKIIELGGTVLVNNKVQDDILVSVIELEKSVKTNQYGKFKISFSSESYLINYSLRFSNSTGTIDTLMVTDGKNLNFKYYLFPKKIDSLRNKPKLKTVSFNIKGVDKLESKFKQAGYSIDNIHPIYSIFFGFSGSMEEVDKNLFRYNGGNLTVSVNNLSCSEFENLHIAPTFSGGNDQGFVKNNINQQIHLLVLKNSGLVFDHITKCIR